MEREALILANDTPFHVVRQTAELFDPPLAAVVIVKATCDLLDDGSLRVCSEQAPLDGNLAENSFGAFHGEYFFKKQGTDLCVLGTVKRDAPVESALVRLRVGDDWSQELRVTGDRVWVPSSGPERLVPSAPTPYVEMPLGYARTYGGSAEYDGELAPFPDNPVGRGYYLTEAQAEGHALPNVELAAEPPLPRWDAQGNVAGWGPYPSHWGLRAGRHVTTDAERYVVMRISPGIFNHAHPDLVFDALATGARIDVSGLDERPLSFRVPEPLVSIEVTIGERTAYVKAPIDGVFVWADARKVVFTQRALFKYTFVRGQFRRVSVRMSRTPSRGGS